MSFTGSLSTSELEDLRQIFEMFDTEQKGSISLLDLRSILQQVAKETKRPSLDKVLALPAFQTERDRTMSQNEFIQLLTSHEDSYYGGNDARRVFELFDTEKKGYISIDDLRRVASELGETMGEEELDEMIQRAASSQEGRVTLRDFEAVMNQKLFA